MIDDFSLTPRSFSLTGGAVAEPPVGSIAELATPFAIPYEGKSVQAFKKFATGRWGTYPGNLWSVASFPELLAVADVARVITPTQAVEDFQATQEPEPRPGTDGRPAREAPTAKDLGSAVEQVEAAPATAKPISAKTWGMIAAGAVALVVVAAVARATK